jgi:hypothetical protein
MQKVFLVMQWVKRNFISMLLFCAFKWCAGEIPFKRGVRQENQQHCETDLLGRNA